MPILKIKIEGPPASGKSVLERLLRNFLLGLEEDGLINETLSARRDHEIEIDVESVNALLGKE